MLIKKETEYAFLSLIELSKNEGADYSEIKMLARKINVSETLLSKTFQKLAAAQIVESKFGPGGGFRLLKKPEEISLWQVFNAVQISNVLKCYGGKEPYCPSGSCPLKKTVAKIEKYIQEYLSSSTLKDLIKKN